MPSVRFLPLVLGIAALLFAQTGLAKTYKWVDENGVTQYTQTPPPKGDYKRIKTTKPAVDPAEARKKLQERVDAFGDRRKEAAENKDKAAKESEASAKKQADCEKAKKNLKYYQDHARVKYKDDSGNIKLLGEEERQAKMDAIRENIKKLCN